MRSPHRFNATNASPPLAFVDSRGSSGQQVIRCHETNIVIVIVRSQWLRSLLRPATRREVATRGDTRRTHICSARGVGIVGIVLLSITPGFAGSSQATIHGLVGKWAC